MDLIKLPAFPNVPASGKATLNLKTELAGRSLHGVVLEQGGTAYDETHISEFKFSIGSKAIVSGVSGTELRELNEHDGIAHVTGYLAMFFGDPTAGTLFGQHLTDIDFSLYVGSPVLEITNAGATAPTCQAYALVGPPKVDMAVEFSPAEQLLMRALLPSVLTPAAAVTNQAQDISLGSQAGAHLRKLALFHANLTAAEFKKQGFVRWDNVSVALNDYVNGIYGRVTKAGLYVLDRILDGYQGKAENTVDADGRPYPYQVNITTSGADTINAVADVRAALALL